MKRSLYHILNGYAHNMFAHRNVSWTVEQSGCIFSVTIAGLPVLNSAIGNGFLHASVGFLQIIRTSHAEILYANIL